MTKIVQDFAMLDDLLSVVIARYFVDKSREQQFVTLIADRMSFTKKLSILRKVHLSRRYKSLAVLEFLERLSVLRNIVAHSWSWSINDHSLSRLLKRSDVVKLLDNFPAYLDKEVNLAISRLSRLQYSRDFLGKVKAKKAHNTYKAPRCQEKKRS